MPEPAHHELQRWINGNVEGSKHILAGSLGPGLTLKELTKLSTDPDATAQALDIYNISLAGETGPRGGLKLREHIASLYDQSDVKVTADDVITTNATTGANFLVLQSLIAPGDHVVLTYPSYAPLLEIPKLCGANISYWRLDPQNDWKGSLDDLKLLLKPTTKVLVLNNPHNPTGAVLPTSTQQQILNLAAQHNITVLCDEIFRPLFHTKPNERPPTSIVEHASYDRTIATGSLSKAWCFSGIRIGWIVTRNPALRKAIMDLRQWVLVATGMIDERIAAEVLSPRCRAAIHARISANARANLVVLDAVAARHEGAVAFSSPPGGSTAFVQFLNPATGRPVDDLEFCRRLKVEREVLLSPGSTCFGALNEGDFRGFVRVHLTCHPDTFKQGWEKISEFLTTKQFADLDIANGTNGVKENGSA